jgi:hypothetical protein
MSIETRSYENTHGCKPAPTEFGAWIFKIVRGDGATADIMVTDSYRKACRQAMAEATSFGGASGIYLQP